MHPETLWWGLESLASTISRAGSNTGGPQSQFEKKQQKNYSGAVLLRLQHASKLPAGWIETVSWALPPVSLWFLMALFAG